MRESPFNFIIELHAGLILSLFEMLTLVGIKLLEKIEYKFLEIHIVI